MKQFRIAASACLSVLFLLQPSFLAYSADSESQEQSAAISSENPSPAESQVPLSTEPISPESSESERTEDASASESSAPEVSATGNVTVDFKDADIQNVLRIISFKSGVNIVAGSDVTGQVTIRLVDVPWEKALDVVLKTYGFAYEKDGNIIRVTTLDSLKKGDLSTEVYTLNYATASEVVAALKDILSERGKAQADTRSNSVVVTDMPTVLAQTKKVIERLDKGPAQVMINSKIIETTLGSADRLGIRWGTQVTLGGSRRPTSFPFPATQRTAIRRFLPPGQQSLEVTDGAGGTADNAIFPAGGAAENIQPTFPLTGADQFTFGTLDFTQFQAVLEAIQTRDNSKILSEPHVIVMNNQEARVTVGDTIAIPNFERNSTTGRMEITGYRDRAVGITLIVTPQINSANEIVLTINPSVTTLLGYDTLATDIVAPHFTNREAKTQIRIKDGETVAIGGLIKDNTTTAVTKVPILGDLPIAGKLFKFKNKTGDKTDLLFFMTVHILTDKQAAPQGHKM